MDKYDVAIAYLTEHPEKIGFSWLVPGSKAGCLFAWCSPHGVSMYCGKDCGCPVMIREDEDYVAADESLTERIRNDERIPKESNKITLESLPVFAEYQREMDVMWGRT